MGHRPFITLISLILIHCIGATSQVKIITNCTLDDLRNITNQHKLANPLGVRFLFADCDLPVLPDALFANVPSSQSINITHSNISTISPYVFSELKQLQSLIIVDNPNLTLFQSWAPHNLDQLIDLDVHNNGIREIDTLSLRRYPKLSHFNLSENFVSQIPVGFFDFSLNIETLDLSINALQRIESHNFKALLRLVDLNLAHNQINYIDSYAFTTTTRLKTLDLNGNQIATINSMVFYNLARLEYLNVRDNALNEDSIEDQAFEQNAELIHLDISNNSFSTFSKSALSGLKSLQVRISL